MTSVDEIINGILEREKEGTPPDYLAPGDAGGRTTWGISERAHPEAWRNGPPTKQEARMIYYTDYVSPWVLLRGINEPLTIACIDDGVMSGVETAVKRLQYVLGVPMDGKLGPVTLRAVQGQQPAELLKRYVVERAVRITRLVQRRPSDLVNLTGWITRILSFLP